MFVLKSKAPKKRALVKRKREREGFVGGVMALMVAEKILRG